MVGSTLEVPTIKHKVFGRFWKLVGSAPVASLVVFGGDKLGKTASICKKKITFQPQLVYFLSGPKQLRPWSGTPRDRCRVSLGTGIQFLLDPMFDWANQH